MKNTTTVVLPVWAIELLTEGHEPDSYEDLAAIQTWMHSLITKHNHLGFEPWPFEGPFFSEFNDLNDKPSFCCKIRYSHP